MIKFEKVTKAYAGETLLEEISFKLNKGDKCGLVGRNGSGKTTILRLISGEESPDSGSIETPRSYVMGYLSQHLHFSKPTLLEEAASSLREEEKEETYKVEKILFGLGFKEEDLQKNPKDFSGGYQLRIHLTKVLAAEPDCLLLDEPTNYLDIVSIRWFTRFLKAWKGEFILISHDREFMDNVTTHTLGVHRKKVRKIQDGTEKFYTQLVQDEEIHEKTRMNLEKKRTRMESFVTRFGAKASKASQAQSRKKALDRMPALAELVKLRHLDFHFPYANFPGTRILEVENLSFSYSSMQEELIKDFNLLIDKHDRIAIVGKNGRGKSTLLRLLVQELIPQKGGIKISANTQIGYFGQTNIDRLDLNKTIEEEIAASAPHLSFSEVRNICGVMMFSDAKAKKKIGVLSGGERSRVLLGKILASPCNLLLLDEPTNHLDMESIEALMESLDQFEGAIVIVTHSEAILKQIPQKFVICHLGNQHLFVGDYQEFLEKEGWEKEAKKPTVLQQEEKEKKRRVDSSSLRSSLKPIQKQIESVEKKIINLEVEKEQELQELIKASETGQRDEISKRSKSIDEKTKQIESLFTELETLLNMLEKKKMELDHLL